MTNSEPRRDGERAARHAGQIIKLLCGEVSKENARVQRRVSSFMRNAAALIDLARRSDMSLHDLHSDSVSEFYCDVYQGSRDVGFISKGWTDPGVRVGDVIYFAPSVVPTFEARAARVLDVCSVEGVALLLKRGDGGCLEAALWTPLYGDLQGIATLRKAMKALHDCRKGIARLCPFTRTLPEGSGPSRLGDR